MTLIRIIRVVAGMGRSRRWAPFTPSAGSLIILLGCVQAHSAVAQCLPVKNAYPQVQQNGYVPDGVTAVRIAEAVLAPLYSQEELQRERPFGAHLNEGVWTVLGSIQPTQTPGDERLGGVAVVEICRSDGRILSVIHEK